ncbi:hypothetical protein [Nitratireductor sp. ZSWI3]|nr:hypothetical protein [Nitratireductor sp. ZSWI3]MCR4264705.1 hypothetical protein [Nitratireductor sp. ZSWI3]
MKDENDKSGFTRESFTFRRMKAWQIWALLAVAILLIVYAVAQ